MVTNESAEYYNDYKERLLKVMRDNMALGVPNDIYENVVAAMVSNRATFVAVFAYSSK